ncbi:zinc ribbon domain-containing protein [Pseudonocardia sp. RS11V-5]|uniref:FmdB family zinc ribbon protein n=1 Tax=Pseudonocardia terrae TaxID=2905831 RepID=UPI001E338E5F|nr:zinc ribbon domain-containing protein [Pseudonocardia terrae]MCE3554454.1 zinc ribbon domain-containing protein [Pseudonocardia terrae]
MAVLVQYRCRDCGRDGDHWVSPPVPAQAECPACAGPARRRFGGALLRGAGPGPAPAQQDTGHACTPDVPGTCTLVPTAARMLAARARGDNRAIDRESERQTRAIAEGTLDPKGSLQTLFADGPAASA